MNLRACLKSPATLAFTAIFILVVIAYILQHRLLDNYFFWDSRWPLFCADQLLQGKKYYTDFFETNPPLIILFHIPFVLLGHLLSLSPLLITQNFFFLLILLFLVINLKLLKNIFSTDRSMIYFSLFLFALVELLFPIDALGNKEHLILIAFVPYLLLLTQRCSKTVSINIGLSASIGFFLGLSIAIKPYFILPVLLCEMYYGIKLKKIHSILRPEIITMLLFGFAYILSVIIFFPEFYSKVLPLVTTLYFPFFRTLPFGQLIQGLPILVLGALVLSFQNKSKYTDYFWLLRLMTFGFLMAFFIAKQNWYYHCYPALALSYVLLSSIIFLEVRPLLRASFSQWERIKKISLIFLSVIVLILQLEFVIKTSLQYALTPTSSITLHAPIQYCNQIKSDKEKNVLILSTFFHTVEIPLICEQATPSSRFPNLVLLPGIVELRSEKYKKIFFTMLNEDLKKHPPTVIIIDDRGYSLQKHPYATIPFLPFLLSDPVFREMFSHYHFVKKIGYFSFFVFS